MNFIIDPIEFSKIPINSTKGKDLLKQYVTSYQLGGTKKSSTPKGKKEVEIQIKPCEKKFCNNNNIVCETDFKDEKGIRKCGVLIKSDWPESLNKYFNPNEIYEDLPISAVFYNNTESNKLNELNSHMEAIKHVHGRIIRLQDFTTKGNYGNIYTLYDNNPRYQYNPGVMKIVKESDESTHYYYDSYGKYAVLLLTDKTNKIKLLKKVELETMTFVENININTIHHYNMFEIQFVNGDIMKRDISLMNDFKKKNERNEVDITGMYKTKIHSNLQEAVLLHKLSQIKIGKGITMRTASPHISGVYIYMNGIGEYYFAYSMDKGNSLENVFNKISGVCEDIIEGILGNINEDIQPEKALAALAALAAFLNLPLQTTQISLATLKAAAAAYNSDLEEYDPGTLKDLRSHLRFINTMQTQIYELLAVQYDAGYINLDFKSDNLLVNDDNNIQIIDSGITQFTHEVKDILTELDDTIKREIIIFAQQLMITLYLKKYDIPDLKDDEEDDDDDYALTIIFKTFTFQTLPTAIEKLKERGITSQQVGEYLITIKDDIEYSYSYMLNLYTNLIITETKEERDTYVKKMTDKIFSMYDTTSYISPSIISAPPSSSEDTSSS